MWKYFIGLLIPGLPLLLISCTGNEFRNGKIVNPNAIYFDYKVWGDEDGGYIAVRLQYKVAGKNGIPLLLPDPAKAELDGMELKADSSKMNGTYYEADIPVEKFTGKHTIVFTNINKKQYREEFVFRPIRLRTSVPEVVQRRDLIFDLDGLEREDYVRVLLSDTAAFSEGISRIDTVRNGRIIIKKAQLRYLVNGPAHLEFSREDERRIKDGTAEGGRLSISYGLKRDFELRDSL